MSGEPTAAWVRPYAASGWVLLLSGLGADFPAPGSSEAAWGDFVHSTWVLPWWLLLLGVVAAAAIPLALHYCEPEVKPPQGLPGWSFFAGAAGSTLLCLFATVACCVQVGGQGFAAATAELEQASLDVRSAGNLALALNASGFGVLKDLGSLYAECPPQIESFLGGSVKAIESDVRGFLEEVQHVSASLPQMPQVIASAKQQSQDEGSLLALWLALPAMAVVACCVAVGLAFAVASNSGERWAQRFQAFKMPRISLAGIAPTIILVSVAAATELSVGIQSSALCRDVDAMLVGYAGEEFGNESEGFNLTKYYVVGEGINSPLAHLALAQARISSCMAWMSKYEMPIQKTCPNWDPSGVVADLRTLAGSLTTSEALLAPSNLYSRYSSSVHGSICGSAVTGLGGLVVWQALLGLTCLPALALTGNSFLKSVNMGREFQALSRQEQGADEGAEGAINPLYYVVYALAVFVFIVGALMYFIPSTALVRRISGTLLYACGIFLLSNSDLVVTFLRLYREVGRFKENNAHFQKSLDQQSQHIRTLTNAAKGLKEVDEKFGGNIAQAQKEVEKLSISARTQAAMCAKQLCRLYADTDKSNVIEEGQELNDVLELMNSTFGGVVRDYADRESKLQATLRGHPSFQKTGGVKGATFAKLMECMLLEGHAASIPDAVCRLLDGSAGGDAGKPRRNTM